MGRLSDSAFQGLTISESSLAALLAPPSFLRLHCRKHNVSNENGMTSDVLKIKTGEGALQNNSDHHAAAEESGRKKRRQAFSISKMFQDHLNFKRREMQDSSMDNA